MLLRPFFLSKKGVMGLVSVLNNFELSLHPQDIEKLEHFAKRLLEENAKVNLTATDNYEELLERHVVDSLIPMKLGVGISQTGGCDIGSGGGFPGIVLACLQPDKKWVLCESDRKKSAWLKAISGELDLKDVSVVNERVETVGHLDIHRESYDLCTSRALAKAPVMLEYCLPLVKVGGELWTWQGDDFNPFLWERALGLLGGRILDVKSYRLPCKDENRHRLFVRVQKVSPTPEEFPRKVGIPKKRPLV